MIKQYKIENTDKTINIELADTFFKRFLGLMGRKQLSPATGLLIKPCNSIHMMFMRFSIDAVYLDRDMKVVKIAENIMPWIGLSMCQKAESVLEMAAGEARNCGFFEGVILKEI